MMFNFGQVIFLCTLKAKAFIKYYECKNKYTNKTTYLTLIVIHNKLISDAKLHFGKAMFWYFSMVAQLTL